jgi:predicted metal-dependent HD superfamily phosphohydrolase
MSLWQSVRARGDALPWYERLAAAYVEPHRHYHNQRHIAECLAAFDSARHLARWPEAVEMAIWFHDAIYDPKAADNEKQSAQLAKRCLAEAGIATALSDTVNRLIMATQKHEVGDDPDAALMVDIDLSIFGQPEERFLEYEKQIRREYAWVPKIIFAPKRAQILEGFLRRDSIYRTDSFRTKYESSARRNLERSIDILRGRSRS